MGPQGFATFPGVERVMGCTYTLSHGISPGVAMLDILPQQQMPNEGGTLTIGCGTDAVSFSSCKIDKASFRRDASGLLYQFALFDRRWKWAFGAISGWYNVHKPDFSLWPATEKAPQALARLCLDAMGETSYDVSRLPNDARPEVEWDGVRPMDALAQLCDLLGCRIVMGLDGGVRIYPLGVGSSLPAGAIMEQSATIDPSEIPSKIAILCGHNRYQHDFELEPVGMDTDGKIVHIDSLSYRPTNGWNALDLPKFGCVTEERGRELAQECIFRWYRIKVPFALPGYTDRDEPGMLITDLKQIVPIEDHVIKTFVDHLGVKQSWPASVHGVYLTKLRDGWTNSDQYLTPNPSVYLRQAWSLDVIDGSEAIVKFSEPIYRNVNTTGAKPLGTTPPRYGPALLRLRAVCSVRSGSSRGWMRWRRSRETGGTFQTETAHWTHDEITLNTEPTYDASTYDIVGLTTNQTELDRECDYYLDAIQRELVLGGTSTARYLGTLPIEPDGAIQQVTWSVSPTAGHYTTASWGDEHAEYVMPYKERRQREKQKQLERERAAMDAQAKKFLRRFGRGRDA